MPAPTPTRAPMPAPTPPDVAPEATPALFGLPTANEAARARQQQTVPRFFVYAA